MDDARVHPDGPDAKRLVVLLVTYSTRQVVGCFVAIGGRGYWERISE